MALSEASLKEQIATLDHPLLKVPVEHLNRTFRATYKLFDNELKEVTQKIVSLSTSNDNNENHIKATLAGLLDTLKSLQTQLEISAKEEHTIMECLLQRIDHVKAGENASSESDIKLWCKKRLDRILIDYLLREGRYETAEQYAKAKDLEILVDINMFETCRRVESVYYYFEPNCIFAHILICRPFEATTVRLLWNGVIVMKCG
eukprot:m.92688 g.92688  ORF g.92688 m.92688 type:complete len:204 (-) comp13360_c0_seq2:1433-2044(-)